MNRVLIIARRRPVWFSALLTLLLFVGLYVAQGDQSWHRDWHYFQHQSEVTRATMMHGSPPDYNPWHCSGFDVAENPQDLSLSPSFTVVLLGGHGLGLRLLCLLWLCLGAASMTWFLRKEGLSKDAAIFGGLFWGASPFLHVHLSEGHVPFASFAVMPLALGLMREAYRARSTQHGAAAWSYAMGAGAVMAGQVALGGVYAFPFTALAIAMDGAARSIGGRSLLCWPLIAGAAIISIVLSLPRLLPLFSLWGRHPRPKLGCDSLDASLLWSGLFDRTVSVEPMPGHPFHWPEYVIYPGVLVLSLAILGVALSRGACAKTRSGATKPVYVGVIGLIGFWLMLGDVAGLHRLLHVVPMIGDLQVPTRFGVLFVFAAVVLAARALHRLGHGTNRVRKVAVTLVAMVSLFELVTLDWAWLDAAPTQTPLSHTVVEAPLWAGPFQDAPVRMDQALADRHVISDCYEPAPHAVPVQLRDAVIPFVADGEGKTGRPLWHQFSPTVMSFRLDPGSTLVLGQAYREGWSVRGGALFPVSGGLLGIRSSEEHVTMSYKNSQRRLGLMIQFITAVFLFVQLYRVRRRSDLASGARDIEQ